MTNKEVRRDGRHVIAVSANAHGGFGFREHPFFKSAAICMVIFSLITIMTLCFFVLVALFLYRGFLFFRDQAALQREWLEKLDRLLARVDQEDTYKK
ncbi:hypothetical protein [Caenibacillus caldisaponilyticus]|uniref:hypothetical protein n=1 Tax=Caenibacillus caldisaponilyticus TaxID=1674942 RepID=UPI0009889377|nr:hypothetical protein [Caenibacillus caldisaponilyticus]